MIQSKKIKRINYILFLEKLMFASEIGEFFIKLLSSNSFTFKGSFKSTIKKSKNSNH